MIKEEVIVILEKDKDRINKHCHNCIEELANLKDYKLIAVALINLVNSFQSTTNINIKDNIDGVDQE